MSQNRYSEEFIINSLEMITRQMSQLGKTLNLLMLQNEQLKEEIKASKNPRKNEYLSGREVQGILSINYLQFIKLIEKGILNARKDGKKWKVHQDELNNYKKYIQEQF